MKLTAFQNNPYTYYANVRDVVDGDTMDLEIDLGFGISSEQRVRANGIDTHEIHTVATDTEEYQRGMDEVHALREWCQQSHDHDGPYPFVFHSDEYHRGKYGRIIGDLYSFANDEWWTEFIVQNFEDVIA